MFHQNEPAFLLMREMAWRALGVDAPECMASMRACDSLPFLIEQGLQTGALCFACHLVQDVLSFLLTQLHDHKLQVSMRACQYQLPLFER